MWIGQHRLLTESDEVASEKRIASGSLLGSMVVGVIFAVAMAVGSFVVSPSAHATAHNVVGIVSAILPC